MSLTNYLQSCLQDQNQIVCSSVLFGSGFFVCGGFFWLLLFSLLLLCVFVIVVVCCLGVLHICC